MLSPVTARRRWFILALLVGFSMISYIERTNLSVAGLFIRRDLGVSDVEIGWMFSAFLLAYTLAQLPSGALADRYGPHKVLSWAAAAWFLLTVATAAVADLPGMTVAVVVGLLVLLRFALGLAEAPTYPAATRAVANWFPSRERATANSVIQSASYAGSAITMPFMVAAVGAWGWQSAILASAVPALVIGLLWWRYAGDRASAGSEALESDGDIQAAEAARIGESREGPLDKVSLSILSSSYFFHGAVGYVFFFWFYAYLVEERGFSGVQSGWVAALPTAAAAVFALLGGWASDRVAQRFGAFAGRRILLVASGVIGGTFLLVGAYADDPAVAIGGFVAAIAMHGFVEASYWTLVIDIGRHRVGLAAGAMNAASNLGGVVSTASAPLLVHFAGWPAAIAVVAAARVISGLLALAIRSRGTRDDPIA